jgi:hydroxyethylthiazole kinase-like uncharacterized protein yjeF
MRKLITVTQIREADTDCLKMNNLSSISLMEGAANGFVNVFSGLIPEKYKSVLVLCGTGNNGGDGLAIARLLQCRGYSCIRVLIIQTGERESPDFLHNLKRLKETPIEFNYWNDEELEELSEDVVIDAILGSGVNRHLSNDLLMLVESINRSEKYVIAVDCPTGFRCDGEFHRNETVLIANDVVSFQRPKLNFFFPESAAFLKTFHVVDIGLREEFIEACPSNYYLIESQDLVSIYRQRESFSHKGTFGHVLIYAGSTGKSGAALLCAEACIYSGAGLTSVSLPQEDRVALHIRLPEAMYVGIEEAWGVKRRNAFSAIAMGPGLGNNNLLVEQIIRETKVPLVIDADALNYLAFNQSVFKHLPKSTILTPHMKEFDRLFGDSDSWRSRLLLAVEKAKEYQIIIVLKNRYTFIILEDGQVLINPTGNPAMASGGMGDVLTGIIVSFLAQGYTPKEACILACYLHGKAGDSLAAAGRYSISATQLIAKMPFIIGDINR